MSQERLLRDALADQQTAALRAIQHHAVETLNELVAAGRADRSLHPDITVDDIALLLRSAPSPQTAEAERSRWVDLARRALAPAAPAADTRSRRPRLHTPQ